MTAVSVVCACGTGVTVTLQREIGSERFIPNTARCTKCRRRMLISAVCEPKGRIEAYLIDPEDMANEG